MKADLQGLNLTDKEIKKIIGVNDLLRLNDVIDTITNSLQRDIRNEVIRRPSVLNDSKWPSLFAKFLSDEIISESTSNIRIKIGWILFLIILVITIIFITVADKRIADKRIDDDLVGGVLIFLVFTGIGLPIFSSELIKNKVGKRLKDSLSLQNKVDTCIEKLQSTRLGCLLDEVDNYNKAAQELVSYINVIDQLAEAGNPVSIKDRENTINIYKKMRENLIRALKTERIFRENPNVQPEQFSIDFMLFKTLEFDEQAKDCERLVNTALEIGHRVQEEMRNVSITASKI